jgi:hypothetical protein
LNGRRAIWRRPDLRRAMDQQTRAFDIKQGELWTAKLPAVHTPRP